MPYFTIQEWMHVVEVHDVRPRQSSRVGDLLGRLAAVDQGPRGSHAPGVRRIAEVRLIRHARTPQRRYLQVDRAFLAAVYPIAVVDDEDARVGHLSPSAGTTCSLNTCWIAPRR